MVPQRGLSGRAERGKPVSGDKRWPGRNKGLGASVQAGQECAGPGATTAGLPADACLADNSNNRPLLLLLL